MWKVSIDSEKCEGDGDCVDACPVMILALNSSNSKKTACLSGQEEDCLGCMACTTACSTHAIAVVDV